MVQPIYLSPKQSKQPPAQIQNSKKSRLRIKSQNHFLALSHFIFAVNLTTMEEPNSEQENQLSHKIAAILDEVRTSYATHNRKLKELSLLRSKSSSPSEFFSAFSKSLIPLFNFQKRLASADRVVSFVSSFTAARNPADAEVCDEFLDHFLHFLLVAATAADKTVRFRACQIVSEVTN
jgi:condensin complex subunit 3